MSDASEPRPLLRQWRLIALIFGLLALILGGWYYLSVRDNFTLIYSDLPAPDAAAITADLSRRGVRFETADNGRNILVPALDVDRAHEAASAAGAAPHAIEGFELFDQSDLGLNDFAQRIRYQRAIQGELERTIMTMDGVISARVHVSIPDRTPFRGEQQPPGAAVTLVTRTPQDLDAARVEGIQRLIAASVAGMTASDVVVLDGRGEVLSPRVEIADISGALLGGDGQARRTAIDLVTQVMRGALPDRQFEVRIEQAAAAQPNNASPGAGAPVFTRIVRIATELALTPLEQEHVRAALSRAGLVDGSLEETVLFSVGLASEAGSVGNYASDPAAGARPHLAPLAAPQQAGGPSLLSWLGSALALALVLALVLALALIGAWLWLRRRTSPLLSSNEQQDFAERLRQALSAQPGLRS